MDYCDQAWEGFVSEVKRVCSKDDIDNIAEADVDTYFLGLQRLVERKTRLFWHKELFDKYVLNQIIPWGLRI